jgi:hypothetical protein
MTSQSQHTLFLGQTDEKWGCVATGMRWHVIYGQQRSPFDPTSQDVDGGGGKSEERQDKQHKCGATR